MKPVRDEDGRRYLLLKRSSESSLVRDPATGETRHIPTDQLETLPGASPLEMAAAVIDESVRTLLLSIPDERTLGLVLEIDAHGELGVRTILDRYDFCESDLHGRLTVLNAAGVLEETTVNGERGYTLTSEATQAISVLRTASTTDEDD
ncbi:DUF7346 family protein [Natronosalvus vescus]|uniref:DUF7346 family protein n=1 Tax=Natronosalvus vescus TaxID=2953881 RepID=UPI002091BACB|nr:hypothetical protein [Natronosalvus vescus]